ncbi:hypothetical protein MIN45_P1466 [Methylomarinovum tepidoasis]|uniref:DUF2760 domain-containing protein n=1 Tax=Methylomarinovum tepidoasis TaxID=2840183 RepID=A0AAU9CAZ6_9GAMM|nr:DUF2760 domain-containing protein [Methylomarinovum sp. IN45]BCX89096.1 hypothetical protein MIN45_P1466 [Methylomarinovum sp. IN45]
MNIDISQLPQTLDALHLILGIAFIVTLFLLVLVLTVAVLVLLRRSAAPAQPQVIEKVVEKPAPAPTPPPTAVREEKKAERSAPPPKPVILREPTPDAALQLLGLFQSEARLLDFLEEDISAYSDADVGAAARIVHEGCRKVLHEHFDIEPVRPEEEGTRITIPKGFDPAEIRLTGNIVGEPPFQGVLVHRGWHAVRVKLPQLSEGHRVDILAPAEVEL